MAETIRGLPEVVDSAAGGAVDCLEARTAAMRSFEGLGPSDLCRLTKSVRAVTGAAAAPHASLDDAEDLRFFHYVLGIDVADASHVSQYIMALIAAQEKVPWRLSLLGSHTWTIRGGVYCCYDAFNRVDVRVEVRIPGMPGVVAYAVDEEGEQGEPSREIWECTRLSALLRAVQAPHRLPAHLALPLLSACPEAVATFVRLASKHFALGEDLGLAREYGKVTHVLAERFCGFLIASRRLGEAIKVFSSLQSQYPTIALHIARAYAKRRQNEAALSTLSRALRAAPEDAALLHYEASLLLRCGDCAQLALDAAHLAVQLQPSVWLFWATLARAYVQAGRLEEALLALNSSVFSQDSGEVELGVPDLGTAEQTMPKAGALTVGALSLEPTQFELMPGDERPFTGFGRGFGLDPILDDASATPAMENEQDLIAALSECHGASLLPAEQAVYKVVVALYRQIGWDELLSMRERVFLMDDEEEAPVAEGDEDELDDAAAADELDQTAAPKAAAPGPALRRRLCGRFLDRLFQALHTDLCLYNEWCSDQLPGPPRGSSALWMHRGALAERLQQEGRTEIALRLCQARGVCPRASLRLLKLYERRDLVVASAAQLLAICALTAKCAEAGGHRLRQGGCWPDWVFNAASHAVCCFGLSRLRGASGDHLPASCLPHLPLLQSLLSSVEQSGTEGWDR